MLRKLMKLFFVLVTIEAFSLPSANHKNVTIESNTIVYRLPMHIAPIHYDLKLESGIMVGDFNFIGETDIKIEVREPSKLIVLNWKNLTINETQSRLDKDNGESVSPSEHHYDPYREMLTLIFDKIIDSAVYTLHLEFSDVLSTDLNGFFRSSYINENGDTTWLAATHFQPISARRAFPCWDEPAFKTTFNISLKHHANYTALSNMPVLQRSFTDESNDTVWTRFERTPIMATNILAFVISDFKHISIPERNITIWARKSVIPSIHFLLKVIPKIDDELNKYMPNSVMVPKIDHVALPDYNSHATENWGLITYREKLLMYKENESTADKMDRILMLIAHELAHQWFGNLVGPSWWKYMWMSEGFAAYFQYYITDKAFNDTRMMHKFSLDVMQMIAFHVDNCPDVSPMNHNVSSPSDIPTIYSLITYRKAPIVLRMLSHCISDEIFKAGLLKYIYENKYKTTVPDDLWRSLQVVLDQSNVPHEDFEIKTVMDTWTEQAGYPTIVVNRDYDTGTVQVQQFSNKSSSPSNQVCYNKWWVPLNFATQTNPDFSSTLPTHWLNPSEDTKTIRSLPKDGWIIVNIQQTGYYRVYYDQENWKRIARYLNSDDYNRIHVLNRIQIIDDAFNSVMTNDMSVSIFRMIINYLSQETDPIVWEVVLRIFSQMNHYIQTPRIAVILKPYLQRLLNDKLNNMDYNDNPEEDSWTRRMKHTIKHIACNIDVPECYGNATAQLVEYLANPKSIIIPSDSQNWVFCYGLRNANESVWNGFLNNYMKDREEQLTYLTCSENRTILENYLVMIFSEDFPFSKSDIETVLINMMVKSDISFDTLVDFISKNLNEIFSKTDEIDLDSISYRITTREQLKKMIAIFASKGKPMNKMIQNFEIKMVKINKIIPIFQEFVQTADD